MTREAYAAFARRVTRSGVLTDPWLDGEPRLQEEPVVCPPELATRLARAAADVARVTDEAVRVVLDEPELLETFFCLTPVQRLMLEASAPAWHGIARADVFRTDAGLAVAELNCDTPTGSPEAVVLGALARAERPGLDDPNECLEPAFAAMVERSATALVGASLERSVGLVYPTELTEDLSLVRLYKRWLEAAGWEVALGSPYNLRESEDGGVALFDVPVSVLVRHYKTDWWSERASAWSDEDVPDDQPLTRPLRAVLRAQAEGRVAVVNPFGAVLAQNKRLFAFLWEHLHRLTVDAQEIVRELVPLTHRLEALHPAMLEAERDDWVLKSDYGAEGEEVVIGRDTEPGEWRATLDHARQGRWVAQRRFEVHREPDGLATNWGVFVVAGEPAGLYARRSRGPTDAASLSAPVLVG